MKKRWMALLLVLLMTALSAGALAYDETAFGAENTPQEILDYLHDSRWRGWTITGWVNPGTCAHEAAQAFVAVKNGRENDLLAFKRDAQENRFVYLWHNAAALAQVEAPIELGMAGDAGGTPRFQAKYETEDGRRLHTYWRQAENGTWQIECVEIYEYPELAFIHTNQAGMIRYVDILSDTDEKVYGEYQRELRYFSFSAFPLTAGEAREKLSHPPEIPDGTLSAQRVRFTSGQKYPVYMGPDEAYGQASGGKAVVSTNDWIQVFGEKNGFIMIQYDISSDKMRIGWIKESALPAGTQLGEIGFALADAWTNREVTMTDDPLASRAAVRRIRDGEQVVHLASMGDWAYVEHTDADGKAVCGFVAADALSHDRVFELENHADADGRCPLSGRVSVAADGWLSAAIRQTQESAAQKLMRIEIIDEFSDEMICIAQDNGGGIFVGGGWVREATALKICPIPPCGDEQQESAISIRW